MDIKKKRLSTVPNPITNGTKQQQTQPQQQQQQPRQSVAMLNDDEAEKKVLKRKSISSSSMAALASQQQQQRQAVAKQPLNVVVDDDDDNDETSKPVTKSKSTTSTTTTTNTGAGTTSKNLQPNMQLSAVPSMKRKSVMPTHKQPAAVSKRMLSNDQITEIYANCIKLSNENKINTKNTWQLSLIDHISDVLENNVEEDDMTNFQKASCTLDASVKIYSTRVDSVHTETFRMLGGLSHAEKESSDAENDASDQDADRPNADNAEDANGEKKLKKKKKGINTLEANIDNINSKKFDLQFFFDPLFGKTSAAFDEGGAKGLLLNKLSIYGDCKLVFDSNDAINSTSSGPRPATTHYDAMEMDNDGIIISQDSRKSTTSTPDRTASSSSQSAAGISINLASWKRLFAPLPTGQAGGKGDTVICPTFSLFSDWGTKSTVTKAMDEEDVYDNAGQIDLDVEDNIAFDNDHLSDREDNDDAVPDNYFGGGGGDHFEYDMGGGGGGDFDDDQGGGGDDIRTPNIVNSDNWEEFGFFDHQNWLGPEHWKFKANSSASRSSLKSTAANDQDSDDDIGHKKKKTSSKKKTQTTIDFDAPPPPDSMFEPPRGRQSTVLTANALKKASEISTILPPDIHYDQSQLSRLFNKPQWIIPPLSKRDQFFKRLYSREQTGQGGVNDRQIDNSSEYDFPSSQCLNDDFGGGGGGDHDDSFDDAVGGDMGGGDYDMGGGGFEPDFDNGGDGGAMSDAAAIGINGGKLVDIPNKVAKLDIAYEKVAKRIDVKELKTSVWRLIDTTETTQDTRTTTTTSNQFAEVIDGLNIGAQTSNVSVALAFICVLHLANEKGLSLVQPSKTEEQLGNFAIHK
ncbi:hypothetical protein SAMD00019534_086570 [Acytostelium subglobosum LB1]|uniref:hypothetical protein n=1 Tax=Acytostelium subglobosum LB1 TaxID=1410327 RepID=UPI000644E81F|nr:hypothetical protein SAMD00019534_086570 [Acytostelium subglobosum LB1]GAM25482.1 hypothetical protein SAMD00019534_086570 [Acytostelium subglobosum LB1]|eukprot:XP_012751468.1 hypothetical protein SAMD00019534_086570 [Acytostelium subglobosum LB1]